MSGLRGWTMRIISQPETEDVVPEADRETDATGTPSPRMRKSERRIAVLTTETTGIVPAARGPLQGTDSGTTGGIDAAEALHRMAATGKARVCMVSRKLHPETIGSSGYCRTVRTVYVTLTGNEGQGGLQYRD